MYKHYFWPKKWINLIGIGWCLGSEIKEWKSRVNSEYMIYGCLYEETDISEFGSIQNVCQKRSDTLQNECICKTICHKNWVKTVFKPHFSSSESHFCRISGFWNNKWLLFKFCISFLYRNIINYRIKITLKWQNEFFSLSCSSSFNVEGNVKFW